jgi:hypothetical protein
VREKARIGFEIMDKYAKIKELGLEVVNVFEQGKLLKDSHLVYADSLLSVLDKGVEVNGCLGKKQGISDNWAFDSKYDDETTTHTGLVINLKPLAKPEPVSKEEIVELLKDLRSSMSFGMGRERLAEEVSQTDALIERINKVGLK